MIDPRLTSEVFKAIEALIVRTRHARFLDWLTEEDHPEYALRVSSMIAMATGEQPRQETPEERRARKPRIPLGVRHRVKR